MGVNVIPWNQGAARERLRAEIKVTVGRWIRESTESAAVRAYNRRSQIKLMLLFGGFALSLLVYRLFPSPWLAVALVMVNGAFCIPYTRVFMHSQMHWGLSNSHRLNRVYDRLVSLLFGVSQTGYAHGHRLHHRYDNDLNPGGFPRDKQSTYAFSSDGTPTSIWLWVFYYIFFYQQIYVTYLVVASKDGREILSLVFDYLLIACVHSAVWTASKDFYLWVFLPSLGLAWLASSLTLFEMHNVPAFEYHIHPTNTSVDPFFNWYGDNDGYHLEHTLFSGLHPYYLTELHKLVVPSERQIYRKQYAIESLIRLIRLPRGKSRAHGLG